MSKVRGSPSLPRLPSPPRRLPTAIPSASWHDFVLCLEEAPKTGECTDWASGNNLRDDAELGYEFGGRYEWIDGCFSGFGDKSTFNGDISKWNTGKVTTMHAMFYSASAFNQDIGNWNTAQVTDMEYMFSIRFCVQPRHWELEHSASDYYVYMFSSASAFNQAIGVGTQKK